MNAGRSISPDRVPGLKVILQLRSLGYGHALITLDLSLFHDCNAGMDSRIMEALEAANPSEHTQAIIAQVKEVYAEDKEFPRLYTDFAIATVCTLEEHVGRPKTRMRAESPAS